MTRPATFTPGTLNDQPQQGKDAKCGYACHTVVQKRDCVFTEYGARQAAKCPDHSQPGEKQTKGRKRNPLRPFW